MAGPGTWSVCTEPGFYPGPNLKGQGQRLTQAKKVVLESGPQWPRIKV